MQMEQLPKPCIKDLTPMLSATREDEQAVSIDIEAPVSPRKYEILPAAVLESVPVSMNAEL